MKIVVTDGHLNGPARSSLSISSRILAVIAVLVALYPLVGCSGAGSASPTRAHTVKTPTAAAPLPTPDTQEPGWKLTWSDEFDGPQGAPPDPQKWSAKVGGEGWGNYQLDYDTNNKNVYQDGQGNLVLEARREDPKGSQCWYGACQYTSAQITTEGHFSYTYGRLEARIKLPYGQGIWPAFWLLGDNCASVGWPACGEVDIMENIGNEPGMIHGTVHGPGYFTATDKLKQGAFSDSYHVFALQWDPDHLFFMVDGSAYYTIDRTALTDQAYWVYDHPFYIILDLAVGGVWPGSPDSSTTFPQKMYISYLRLYTSD